MTTTTAIASTSPTLSVEALELEITTLAAHLNAGTFRFLALIADFDTREGWGGWGIRSCAHWLNWKCGLGLNAAREQLRVAHALRALPQVSEAMRQGQLSYAKVRAITRVATVANEQCLLAIARNGTASHVETVVRHYRRTKRVEELARDEARHEMRTLRYFWDHDGCLVIEARLPAEQGALVVQALQAADEALRPHPSPARALRTGAQSSGPRDTADAVPLAAPTPSVPEPQGSATTAASNAELSVLPNARPEDVVLLPLLSGGPGRLGGLDPEQQEALERLEVAAAHHPLSDDASGADATRADRDHVSRPSSRVAPDTLAAAGNVSAVTHPPPLGWKQRQADAFCLMAETMLASGPAALKGGDRHLVHVRVDLEALCTDDGVGTSAIEDGPAIPPETVRRLCCDGGLVTWLHDGAGSTLDVGRKTRVIPTSLRRFVERRDGGCRFPGCEQRRFVDAHHIEHWVDGGRTDADNLLLLCRYHHRTLHEGGFRIRGDAERPHFIDPQGRGIQPAPALRALPNGDALFQQHAQEGLMLNARTVIPGWGGERADYTWMLTMLAQRDRPTSKTHGADSSCAGST